MMAPPLAGAGIIVRATRWEHPLPPPLTSRLWVLRPQRPRQLHPARTLGHIALVSSAHLGEMAQQGTLEALGQHRHAVAVTLSAPHPDLVRREIEVLRPQAQRLQQPHSAAIKQPRDQRDGAAPLEARQRSAPHRASARRAHAPAAWRAPAPPATRPAHPAPRDTGRRARITPGSGWTRSPDGPPRDWKGTA